MWFIIILILLLFLLSPVIKVWRAVRKFQNEYNRTMDQARKNQGETTQEDDEKNDLKARYRRYSDETGEYVNFEEMEGRPETITQDSEQQTTTGSSSKYQDEIVSDAEFEEI
ncbi:MAG: hypothetical protein IKW83_07635 [Muribaculaceae bacterium]|nr:hypothetical protein [Muribaculaceae bacterium]